MRFPRSWRLPTAAALAAALALASPAAARSARAQAEPGKFSVLPLAGYMHYDKASGIKPSGVIGLDAMYSISRILSVGVGMAASRPNTQGDDFIASMTFGDSTLLLRVTQPVTMFDVHVGATVRLPVGSRLVPFVTGGVGSYTLYLDPQVVAGSRRFSKFSATAGGGVDFRVTRGTGIQLGVRDLIFTDFDRNRLNPTAARFRLVAFPEDVPVPPAAKTTVHNLMLILGFSFTPGIESVPVSGGEGR